MTPSYPRNCAVSAHLRCNCTAAVVGRTQSLSISLSVWLRLGTFVALRGPLTRIIFPLDKRRSINDKVLFSSYASEPEMSISKLGSGTKKEVTLALFINAEIK